MSDFLQSMAALSAERAAAAAVPDVANAKPVVPLALGAFDVIAEIKDHSPAEGELASENIERTTQAQRYATGGAAAISVLTEPSRFAGSLQHLVEVVDAVPDTPVMRKDFLVAPIQILEARQAGASGVLLIATMLDDDKLRRMLDCAWENGMFVLLESFDSNDLARSNRLLDNEVDRKKADDNQLLLGVNTRNLRTLEVDSDRLEKLALELPLASCVAESGLHTAEDAARVAGLGYTLALVGTALMRSDDPADLVRQMRAAGSECFSA